MKYDIIRSGERRKIEIPQRCNEGHSFNRADASYTRPRSPFLQHASTAGTTVWEDFVLWSSFSSGIDARMPTMCDTSPGCSLDTG